MELYTLFIGMSSIIVDCYRIACNSPSTSLQYADETVLKSKFLRLHLQAEVSAIGRTWRIQSTSNVRGFQCLVRMMVNNFIPDGHS